MTIWSVIEEIWKKANTDRVTVETDTNLHQDQS